MWSRKVKIKSDFCWAGKQQPAPHLLYQDDRYPSHLLSPHPLRGGSAAHLHGQPETVGKAGSQGPDCSYAREGGDNVYDEPDHSNGKLTNGTNKEPPARYGVEATGLHFVSLL